MKINNLAKTLAFFLTLSVLCIYVGSACIVSAQNENIGRLSRLVTSHNPDNYAIINAKGDTVTVNGKFTSDTPTDVKLTGTQVESENFTSDNSGAFSSEITGKPLENGYYYVYIVFQSYIYMTYLIGYDERGWYIPDNGLSGANAQKLNNVTRSEPIAAAYYISPTGDKDEIRETIDKIQTIADQVCGNIEDDYQKAYLLNHWVADNIYYDHDAAETEVTIETVALCNVLTNHRTTCAGYANLFCALLEVNGIRSVNLKGTAVAGDITYETLTTGVENHEFSAFWYEKEQRWVYVDSCWSGAGDYRDGKYTDSITYDKYFDITGEAFSLNHRADRAEERFYTKALAALEAAEAAEILQTSEPAGSTASEEKNTQSTEGEITVQNSGSVTETRSAESVSQSPSAKDRSSIVPYVIIGIVGVMAVVIGIFLAVNGKRKNK